MLIPSSPAVRRAGMASLSRRVNANSQPTFCVSASLTKLIKKGEC